MCYLGKELSQKKSKNKGPRAEAVTCLKCKEVGVVDYKYRRKSRTGDQTGSKG